MPRRHITLRDTAFLPGLCCLILFSIVGCAKHEPVSVPQAPPSIVRPPVVEPAPWPEPAKTSSYTLGMRAYDAGDIQHAVVLWREAMATETDPAVRQKTLFALAAVRLSQANNESEFNTAMELLDNWAKKAPPGGNGEDPRMLLPALRLLKPMVVVKELKANLERECSRKLSQREDQIRRSVQQQLRALESIHQQIQEKKKGLTNY